jgi:IS30 family transposase
MTQGRIIEIQEKLNNKPRKRFGFKTPNQVNLYELTTKEEVAFIT